MNNPAQIVCFGEILWDVFPDAKVIGGAPLNVALRLNSQGHAVEMISRLGMDDEGVKVISYLKEMGMPLTNIQKDELLKTGEVLITIDEKTGSASYVITEPVAWDGIRLTDEAVASVSNAEIFVFGSLVCRRPTSKTTLKRLIRHAKYSIFDVNLRPPFYELELLKELMLESDFVKMNDEELIEISDAMSCPETILENRAMWMVNLMNLKGACVTKGANGAFVLLDDKIYAHPGYTVKVKDTVGAGDSFLATLIGELFVNERDPLDALDRACAIGALVASKAGANCSITEAEIAEMIPNK